MSGRQHEERHDNSGETLLEMTLDMIAELGHRLSRTFRRRRILFSATALLLLVLILLAACQPSFNTTGTTVDPSATTTEATARTNYLNSFMLAQRIAESINQQDQVTSLFQSIPDQQRQGILLDEYVQYIRLLRRVTTGSITSLIRINDADLAQLLQGLHFAANLKHEGFYFQSGQSNDENQRMAYFQQVDQDGTPYLDRAPIVRALSLQNYAALYFDAIDRSDRDALAVLIRSGADTQEARLQKADRILTFYHSVVATASPAFRVAMVMPDRIVFVQNIYEDTARTKLGTRRMTIYADGAAGFIIDDSIPDTLKTADLKLMTSGGKTILDFSQLQNGQMPTVTSSQLGEIAGRVILHDSTTCIELPNGEHHMTAYYDGIIIEGIGRCDQHQYWRVKVTRITLTDSRFLTSSGLGTSQSINNLLLQYPFADENNGIISGTLDRYNINLEFGLENKMINRITLLFSGG